MPDQFETGTKQVHIKSVGGQIPTQEQAKLTVQEKTLSNVTVGAGAATNFTANLIDMDGFTYIGIGAMADISHSWTINAFPTSDGTNIFTQAAVVAASTSTSKGGAGICYMNYAVIQIINNDAATRTYNVWTRKFNV